ncbi:MAG: acetoin utilization protein AcuC [Gammaproteobacteria bacterium]
MDNRICVMYGDELGQYHFGIDHPFGPKRYQAFKQEFEHRQLDKQVKLCPPQLATEQQLLLFHTQDYINKVKNLSDKGFGFLDYGDTPARQGIYEDACRVVGSTLSAIDRIMEDECVHVFTPIAGLHHAARDRAAGFCVFNDCGIAIEYLRQQYNIQCIAYVDIDAHHGDGVFYAFEDDKNVIVVDFHQDGNTLYPGTGYVDETGKKEAAGTKLNVPLPPDCTDDLALQLWTRCEKFIEQANPEFILLQCGADSIAGDPITQLKLTADFHRQVAHHLKKLADRHCQGRLLAMGGGGYNLENIAQGWNAVVEELLSD